jgi:hypothetical protein
MMDFLRWIFDLLAPVSGFIVYAVLAISLVGISFAVSFVLAKIDAKT